MRAPTKGSDAYAWYSAALHARMKLGEPPEIDENDPRPGWYKCRLVAGGPMAPAKIWLRQLMRDGELTADEEVCCEIGGERFNVYEVWLQLCENPISRMEYAHMTRVREWAAGTNQPEADPRKPIDLLTVKAPRWRAKRNA
jgi:hypothetical protein